MTERRFPKGWEIPFIKPIRKKGKPQEKSSSYRPIYLLPVLGKIMEKMIQKRLQWFVGKNNPFLQSQSSFRKRLSTFDRIICLEEAIRTALEEGKIIRVLLVYFEGAFEKCNQREVMCNPSFHRIP